MEATSLSCVSALKIKKSPGIKTAFYEILDSVMPHGASVSGQQLIGKKKNTKLQSV